MLIDTFDGFIRIINPKNPKINPKICIKLIFSPSQIKAIIVVINAVDEFKIASMLESEPNEAKENITNGIELLNKDKTIILETLPFNKRRYFFCNKKGKKIREATSNLALIKKIGPTSGVAIFKNMKALPHTAPRTINNIQYLNSI